MSNDAYKELFRADTALGKRCAREAYKLAPANSDWRLQMKQRKTVDAYTHTLLRRYSVGNFDNTPTDRQLDTLGGDMQIFLDVDAMVRKQISIAAKELRKEADRAEQQAAAKAEKLRATADLYDEYDAAFSQ